MCCKSNTATRQLAPELGLVLLGLGAVPLEGVVSKDVEHCVHNIPAAARVPIISMGTARVLVQLAAKQAGTAMQHNAAQVHVQWGEGDNTYNSV
jgi:hypothetical protein